MPISERVIPFTADQVGIGTVRFPSGAPIPLASDIAVDPYYRTRAQANVLVEGLQFWPQAKGPFPAVILLHESWGLNVQIKDLGARLAREGYYVILPNLYNRQGGMVTANTEIAGLLMGRTKDVDLLTDINSCCEFLNINDSIIKNFHAVVGFGLGGTLALQFACKRKRLRAAVSYYGKVSQTIPQIGELYCPVLYHHPAQDDWATDADIQQLQEAATARGKQVEVAVYPDTQHAFCNEHRKDVYRPEAADIAWERTALFLKQCFQASK
jgi:carboxymethylenebutenolidase